MLSALQQKKIDKLFSFWDTNNNKSLDKADFTKIARRIAAHYHWEPGSTQYERTHQTLMAAWGQMQVFADEDENAVITPKEWRDYCKHLITDESAYRIYTLELSMNLFSIVDQDEDGDLSQEDWQTLFDLFNAKAEEAAFAFDQIDRDGNGQVSIGEMVEALNDFFRSSDPNVPGNYLFGPLPE